MKVSSLREWDKNPRDISEEKFKALKKFIKKYGLITPLVVDGRDGRTVLGGNMRLRALKELGVREVEVEVVNPKNDAEALEIALLDNATFGKYSRGKLAKLLEKYANDIDVVGIDIPEITVEVDDLVPVEMFKEDFGEFDTGSLKIEGNESIEEEDIPEDMGERSYIILVFSSKKIRNRLLAQLEHKRGVVNGCKFIKLIKDGKIVCNCDPDEGEAND